MTTVSSVTVTARRLTSSSEGFLYAGPNQDGQGEFNPSNTGAQGPDPVQYTCPDMSTASPAEKQEFEYKKQAAAVAEELLNIPDSDRREYGALIYMADAGYLTHTPWASTSNDSANVNYHGLSSTELASVVGAIHNHPERNVDAYGNERVWYDVNNPDRLLVPSIAADWAAAGYSNKGDWITFDGYAALINYHAQANNIPGTPGQSLRFWIVGFNPQSQTYDLHQYGFADRETRVANGKIDSGISYCL